MSTRIEWRYWSLGFLGILWLSFQIFILFRPQMPLLERPLHLVFATGCLLLAPTKIHQGWSGKLAHLIDGVLALGVAAVLVYYLREGARLVDRMEGLDDVLLIDKLAGGFLILIVLENVRRLIGWLLLTVLLLFLGFAIVGSVHPDWTSYAWVPELLRYDGMTYDELLESLTMTANGFLGITTSTSVGLVFYFVLFGACYSAIGGGKLFIDFGLRIAGKQAGGAAKASVISSSLMGSISGSAVANVATTGLFTIPLMRKTGYSATQAAGIEAIASTGGQLMPPIMGVAAFVMAELLMIPYRDIVIAALIPALAFYLSIFLLVHFGARKNLPGQSEVADTESDSPSLLSRWHLLIPPAVLVGLLLQGWSAPLCALTACGACFGTAYLRRQSWLSWRRWFETIQQAVKQAAEVALPIAAIGLIIEVSVQSNLALKFSADLMSLSGGKILQALGLIIVGCLIMGTGLPTVAAYIIGSILFVPALIELGVTELAAHLFVMYYCVLSMITPPVALASYTAAGLAQGNAFKTSLQAFRMSWVAFMIPLAFVFEPALLAEDSLSKTIGAGLILALAITAWAAALEGFFRDRLGLASRLLLAFLALVTFITPVLSRIPPLNQWNSTLGPQWLLWIVTSLGLIVTLIFVGKQKSDNS